MDRLARAPLVGLLALLAPLAAPTGCAFFSPAAPHQPVSFRAPSPSPSGEFPNWSLPPAVELEDFGFAERSRGKYRVDQVKGAGAGTTGAERHLVFIPEAGEDVRFKVKPTPGDLDGINNAPRKEIAAYRIQHLFLDPEDFVVPTTLPFCIPLEIWRDEHGGKGEPNVKGLDCVLAVVALWLKDVTVADPVYEQERFLRDPTYAYYLSNLNVFTYVIGHRDGRHGNFLKSRDPKRPQAFAIDNGSTFNPWGYNYFVPNYDVLRVAAVRKETVDRLRKLARTDLDFLLVAAQMQVDDEGVARLVAPTESLDDDVGALWEGDTIQLGLTRRELDKVWKRIQGLIQQVDDGSLPVF